MIYTNLEAVEANLHGVFESSRLVSTDTGRIHDALIMDGTGKNAKPIACDNGVAIKVGEFTGNGLQERYATIAAIGDRISVTGAPALVKEAFTKAQAQPYNYFNRAGVPAKAYSVDEEDEDIFAVASYQFTNEDSKGQPDMTVIKEGAYVVVDGTGKWTAQAEKPGATYGFIGKVHSLAVGNFYTMVRILTVQNKQL